MVFRSTSKQTHHFFVSGDGRREEEKGKDVVGKGSPRRFVNGNPIKASRQIIDALQMHKQILKFGKGDLRANKEFETPKGLGSSSKGLGDIPIRSKVQISSGASNFLGPVHWRNVSIIRFL
ncbi:uncharacterized protein LOC132181476 isoform X3 [Corylus avellana]|uniref:uncharacterized protein LOC132181476 isoform X3 n=1 Tax=Corylus avellana TaxID=13451 RepID=UPI00286D304E|nr:uncharacterized protein LOC132181476 isoform X3 [Corylus avellana]